MESIDAAAEHHVPILCASAFPPSPWRRSLLHFVCPLSCAQSTTYIIPYPEKPEHQFQYQWWIIEFEFFVFVLTLVPTLFPSILPRMRPVALTFMASALVLVMDNINALWFLLRNDTAKLVFEEYRIQVAQVRIKRDSEPTAHPENRTR